MEVKMKRAFQFLVDHWYIPLFAIGTLLGWWMTRGRKTPPPLAQLKGELKLIESVREAKELQAKLGAQGAAEEVRRQHVETIQRMDAADATKAAALRDDPVALSRFLVKAGRRTNPASQ
jgi:hypothetical protein